MAVSAPSRTRKKTRKKAAKKSAKVAPAKQADEPIVRVELMSESQVPIHAPNGMYWVRFKCPYVECGAEIETLCYAHPEKLICANCHTPMKALAWRKVDE